MDNTRFFDYLLSRQQDIQDHCFHPDDGFVEFRRAEIEQSIPARFEDQVRKYPRLVAVKTDHDVLTYHELNQAANRVARAILAQQGPGEASVLLLFNHDSAMIAAIMGALKAGKIYIALDPSYPMARTTYILQDSQANLVVTNTKNLELAQELAGERAILNVDEIDAGVATDNLDLPLSPDRIAYIIYTSGSTGTPKGVFQNHRNLLHNIMQYTNTLHLSRHDRFSLLYSCSVNGSLRDIFGSLLNGASVYPYDVKVKGLTDLAAWLLREKITFYHSVATLFGYFMEALNGDEMFSDVRLIRFGGERVPQENVAAYRKHFPAHCILYCGMGATETSTVRQLFIDQGTDIQASIVPTGFAVAERDVLLLDQDGRQVEPGEVGQIAIKSRYLALGYWRQPDLTSQKFKPDPTDHEARIYHTGDLGRMSHNGCMVHMGRQDFQVKIRGYRIEVNEIETALMAHEALKQAAVMVRDDPSGSQTLVAYVVPHAQRTPARGELLQALKEKLPDYMLPSAFVTLEKMPLTPNGKINRGALPDYTPQQSVAEHDFVAPRNDLEQRLVNVWENILGVQPVGIQDNFFELGGHSLLAMRLVAQVETVTAKPVSLATLFHNPTIAGLAQALQQDQWTPPSSALLALRATGSKAPFFCVPGNLGNVFTDLGYLARHLDPERPFYSFQDSVDNHIKIETVAAHYVQEMQNLQPRGPYALGGLCWGGSVVYEMAQQLLAAGESVSLLALVEPSRPWKRGLRPYANFLASMLSRFFRRFRQHTGTTSQLESARRNAFLRLKLKVMLNDLATRRYRPKPYPGQLYIIMGRDSLQDPRNQRLNWRNWVTETKLLDIPGSHDTVVSVDDLEHHRESMTALAQILHDLLET